MGVIGMFDGLFRRPRTSELIGLGFTLAAPKAKLIVAGFGFQVLRPAQCVCFGFLADGSPRDSSHGVLVAQQQYAHSESRKAAVFCDFGHGFFVWKTLKSCRRPSNGSPGIET